MKKLKIGILALMAGFFISSCTIVHQVEVTGNPVGTKKGVARESSFMNKYQDFSIQTAAKNGGITKIASLDYTQKVFLFIFFNKTVVTGE